MAERLLGAVVLAALLWGMFAIPYAFLFMFPQPLQIAFFCALVVASLVFVLDWLSERQQQ